MLCIREIFHNITMHVYIQSHTHTENNAEVCFSKNNGGKKNIFFQMDRKLTVNI